MLFCHFIPQIEGHDEIKAFIIVLDPKTISESVTMFALGMSAKAISVKDKKIYVGYLVFWTLILVFKKLLKNKIYKIFTSDLYLKNIVSSFVKDFLMV